MRKPIAAGCLAVLLVGLVAGAMGCGAGGQEPGGISAAELEARRARIRTHFESQRQALGVVETTTLASGQLVDWIWKDAQSPQLLATPPADGIEMPDDPPPPPPAETAPPRIELPPVVPVPELVSQPAARGPPGTVPVAVFDVENYLATVLIPPADPQHVFEKLAPPQPETNKRYYASWERLGEMYGTSGRINVWDTAGPSYSETSIAQVGVFRGEIAHRQSVEVGKIEYYALNYTYRPRLFTFFITDGYGNPGDNLGGYNRLQDGWIQYSEVGFPGMSLEPWESVTDGPQGEIEIEVRLHEGNWWVRVAGEWLGYYPGALFSSAGLGPFADEVVWYGEVYTSKYPSATTTDMGSGAFAEAGINRAAYMRDINYYWSPIYFWRWSHAPVKATDAACYSKDGPFHSPDPDWSNWFFYGGPGADAPGCD